MASEEIKTIRKLQLENKQLTRKCQENDKQLHNLTQKKEKLLGEIRRINDDISSMGLIDIYEYQKDLDDLREENAKFSEMKFAILTYNSNDNESGLNNETLKKGFKGFKDSFNVAKILLFSIFGCGSFILSVLMPGNLLFISIFILTVVSIIASLKFSTLENKWLLNKYLHFELKKIKKILKENEPKILELSKKTTMMYQNNKFAYMKKEQLLEAKEALEKEISDIDDMIKTLNVDNAVKRERMIENKIVINDFLYEREEQDKQQEAQVSGKVKTYNNIGK